MRKVAARDPDRVEAIEAVLDLLTVDVFHPRLKTHKLTGDLKGLWACSAGYDLRVVFRFSRREATEAQAVVLVTIGTHEEVY
jgi:mRNA-degrading endonuclease YafQ of YafQ-DinJ toxin-antitoxin module